MLGKNNLISILVKLFASKVGFCLFMICQKCGFWTFFFVAITLTQTLRTHHTDHQSFVSQDSDFTKATPSFLEQSVSLITSDLQLVGVFCIAATLG
jgi:hypothetical protein